MFAWIWYTRDGWAWREKVDQRILKILMMLKLKKWNFINLKKITNLIKRLSKNVKKIFVSYEFAKGKNENGWWILHRI